MNPAELNFVYIYKRQPLDNTILYSIRSLCKYVKFNKLIIVGDKPDNIKPDVHIPFFFGRIKPLNETHQIQLAARHQLEAEEARPFVLMHDDFLFLKPISTIRNLCFASIYSFYEQHLNAEGANYYNQALLALQGKFYDLHSPMIIDPTIYHNAIVGWIEENTKLVQFNRFHFTKTYIGNKQTFPEKLVDYDVKIYDTHRPPFELTPEMRRLGFCSIDNKNLHKLPFVLDLPPSPYERGTPKTGILYDNPTPSSF